MKKRKREVKMTGDGHFLKSGCCQWGWVLAAKIPSTMGLQMENLATE